MFAALLSSLAARRSGAAAPRRLEVCPPSARSRGATPSRLGRWLPAARQADAEAAARLQAVRLEFCQSAADVAGDAADELIRRMRYAMSMRELWHLRAELFNVVARHHSQDEAGRRLAALNRHFPTRAPRSGFAPLE